LRSRAVSGVRGRSGKFAVAARIAGTSPVEQLLLDGDNIFARRRNP
jgi:hypothetical protein